MFYWFLNIMFSGHTQNKYFDRQFNRNEKKKKKPC